MGKSAKTLLVILVGLSVLGAVYVKEPKMTFKECPVWLKDSPQKGCEALDWQKAVESGGLTFESEKTVKQPDIGLNEILTKDYNMKPWWKR